MGEETPPPITGADSSNAGVAGALIALLGRKISAGRPGHPGALSGVTVPHAMQLHAERIQLTETLHKVQLVNCRANQGLLGKRNSAHPVQRAKVVAFLRPGDEIDTLLPLLGY
jgi:hypothetical protein